MGRIVREGARLRLRVAETDDLDFIMASEADPENARFIVADSRETHAATLDAPGAVHFIVEKKASGEAAGFLMVLGLDSPHHELEWRRVIINERGQGYGQEAMALLTAWSFADHGAHRGWLDCKEHNARALRVYEAAGLRREGFFREAMLIDGRYESFVVLAMLDWEWRARVGAAQAAGRSAGEGET